MHTARELQSQCFQSKERKYKRAFKIRNNPEMFRSGSSKRKAYQDKFMKKMRWRTFVMLV